MNITNLGVSGHVGFEGFNAAPGTDTGTGTLAAVGGTLVAVGGGEYCRWDEAPYVLGNIIRTAK
jgi:hypothetical protein